MRAVHSFLKLLQLHCATFRLKTFIQFLWETDQVQFYMLWLLSEVPCWGWWKKTESRKVDSYLLGMLLDSNGKLVVLGATPVQTLLISLMHPFIQQPSFFNVVQLWGINTLLWFRKSLKYPQLCSLQAEGVFIQMISAMSNSRSCTD